MNGDVISKRYQHTGSAVGKDVYFIGGQELPEKRFDEMYFLFILFVFILFFFYLFISLLFVVL